MKKIFTLSIATMLVAGAIAQNDQRRQRGNSYNDNPNFDHGKTVNNNPVFKDKGYGKTVDYPKYDGRYNNSNSGGSWELREKIESINREYDQRIMVVQNRFFMGRFQEEQKIRMLEEQRTEEICRVKERFSEKDNRYSYNRDDCYKRHNW